MFHLLESRLPTVLAYKVSGTVTGDDFQTGMPQLLEILKDESVRGLLADWTELQGIDEEGEGDRFLARIQHRDRFDRVAVIADRRWRDEIDRVTSLWSKSEIRRFPRDGLDEAWAWLGEK